MTVSWAVGAVMPLWLAMVAARLSKSDACAPPCPTPIFAEPFDVYCAAAVATDMEQLSASARALASSHVELRSV